MANALQDQLLNMGLVDKKSAAQAKKDKYKKNKKNRHNKNPAIDQNKLLAQQQMDDKKKQDRLLNQQKQEKSELKAVKAQIKQLIEMNSIVDKKALIEFNFQHKNLVKRILVSEKIQHALVNGKLAIVVWDEKYHIIAQAVATRIAQRDESYILLLNQPNALNTENHEDQVDDEYADYQIPDDLMW